MIIGYSINTYTNHSIYTHLSSNYLVPGLNLMWYLCNYINKYFIMFWLHAYLLNEYLNFIGQNGMLSLFWWFDATYYWYNDCLIIRLDHKYPNCWGRGVFREMVTDPLSLLLIDYGDIHCSLFQVQVTNPDQSRQNQLGRNIILV